MSRDFNGSTDRLDWSSIANLAGSAVTISIWFYADGWATPNDYLFCANQSSDSAAGVLIYQSSAQEFYFYRGGSTNLYRNGYRSGLSETTWHHLLATHTGTFNDYTTIHIYIDGTEATYSDGNNGATEAAASGKWSLGGRVWDDLRNFNGKIAEVGIWNAVLSTGTISALASGQPPSCYPTNLLFYWPGSSSGTSALVANPPNSTGTADGTTYSTSHPTMISCPSTSKSISDTGTGIDNPLLAALLGLTDSVLGGDLIDLTALLYMIDSSSTSESISITTLAQIIKTVLDVGSGLDSTSISVRLSVPDTGTGSDDTEYVVLTIYENGVAVEAIQILVSLSVSDVGIGTDSVSVLTALLKSIADYGYGIDGLSIAAELSIIELSSGRDGIGIRASLTVSDIGVGTEAETVTKFLAVLKQVTDLASSIDGLSISASLRVPESVLGIDDPSLQALLSQTDVTYGGDTETIQASLSVIDSSSASDALSVLQAIVKAVQDLASGSDFVGSISASIPMSDIGVGTDGISQLLASLLVGDLGEGVDAEVHYDFTTQIVKISFIIGKNSISFADLKPMTISFNLISGG